MRLTFLLPAVYPEEKKWKGMKVELRALGLTQVGEQGKKLRDWLADAAAGLGFGLGPLAARWTWAHEAAIWCLFLICGAATLAGCLLLQKIPVGQLAAVFVPSYMWPGWHLSMPGA